MSVLARPIEYALRFSFYAFWCGCCGKFVITLTIVFLRRMHQLGHGTCTNPLLWAEIPEYQGCIYAGEAGTGEGGRHWVAVYGKWKRHTQASLSLANAERWNIHQSGCLPWWRGPAHPLYFVITLPDPSYHLKPASPMLPPPSPSSPAS